MVELILERVDEGVMGAVEEERLFTEDDNKICPTDREEKYYWFGRLLGSLSEHGHEWSDASPSSNEHLETECAKK